MPLTIDPNAQNPLYHGAMRLIDVGPDTKFVLFVMGQHPLKPATDAVCSLRVFVTGVLNAVTLPSAVIDLAQPGPGSRKHRLENISDDEVFTDELTPLADLGIVARRYKGGENWDNNTFAVTAEQKSIEDFYHWLVSRGFRKTANDLRELLPEWCPKAAPRNPNAPNFALTPDGVVDESIRSTPLLVVVRDGSTIRLQHDRLSSERFTHGPSPSYGYFHPDLGITITPASRYDGKDWWSQNFSVEDTPERRAELLDWLLSQGAKADRAANWLIDEYPNIVKVEPYVESGKLIAAVTTQAC